MFAAQLAKNENDFDLACAQLKVEIQKKPNNLLAKEAQANLYITRVDKANNRIETEELPAVTKYLKSIVELIRADERADEEEFEIIYQKLQAEINNKNGIKSLCDSARNILDNAIHAKNNNEVNPEELPK